MTTMTCLKCGHVGEPMPNAPGFCANCGVMTVQRPVFGAPLKTELDTRLYLSLLLAAVGTVIHWWVLYCLGFVGWLGMGVIAFVSDDNIPAGSNHALRVGLVLGGLVATAIGWYMAFQRRPVAGAVRGIMTGTAVTCLYWMLAR